MARSSGFSFKIDRDSSGWDTLKRTIENLKSGDAYVKVGVIGAAAGRIEAHGDEDEPGPLTNGQLATIHEFGTSSIPARPFILGTFSMNQAKYLALLRTKILPGIYLAQIGASKGLSLLGEIMASDMRNRMVDGAGIPPPLSAATIASKIRKGRWNRKGKTAGASPRPLVDSGRLRNSISYAVVLPGGSGEVDVTPRPALPESTGGGE